MNKIRNIFFASLALAGLAMGQASALPLVDLSASPDLAAGPVDSLSGCMGDVCFFDHLGLGSLILVDGDALVEIGDVFIIGSGDMSTGDANGFFEVNGQFDLLLGGTIDEFWTDLNYWEYLGTATAGTLLADFGSSIGIRWDPQEKIDLVPVSRDVPEPATLLLLGLGLLGFATQRRMKA